MFDPVLMFFSLVVIFFICYIFRFIWKIRKELKNDKIKNQQLKEKIAELHRKRSSAGDTTIDSGL